MRRRIWPFIIVILVSVPAGSSVAQSRPATTRAEGPRFVTGRVTADDAGTPVAKARVSITPSAPGTAIALTDPDGLFSIGAAGSQVTLTIDKAGYASTTVSATAGTRVDVRLQRGAAVEGRVIDEFGEPAVALPVRLRSASTPPLVRVAGTDDRGEFRIGALRPGTYVVSPLGRAPNPADGFTPVAQTQVVLGEGDTRALGFTVPAGQANTVVVPPPPRPGNVTPVGTGTIRGVVRTTDGRPIAHANVSMLARRRDGIASQNVMSDVNGRFAFQDVPPGSVYVLTTKGGYNSPSPIASREVTADDGRTVDVELLFDPIGAIAGVVSDEDGEPLQGVRVQALRVRYERGARRLVPVSDVGTDDLGRYRLFDLVPGQYIVSAAAMDATSAALPGYGRSYYPGTPDATQAQFVTVNSSDAVSGINVWLPRVRTYRVSGRLLDSAGMPSTGGNLSLVPSVRSGEAAMVPIGASIGQDGMFEFATVTPGQYVIHADRGRKGRAVEGEFGSLAVAVADHDVTGLVLRTSAGSSVTGRIVLDSASGAKLPSVADIEITPLPVDFDAAPKQQAVADVRDDGTFVMQGINGARRIEVTRAPSGWTLKEVRSSGLDVTDRVLQFGRAQQSLSDVEVVLTDRLSGVTGTVVSDRGRVRDTFVIAFPTDRDRRYAGSRFMAAARVSDSGTFSVTSLPAGSYYVAAVPLAPAGDPDGWQDPRALESYARIAESVVVRDGEMANVHLRASP